MLVNRGRIRVNEVEVCTRDAAKCVDVSGAPQLKDCGLLVAAGVFESTSSGALHWTSGSWIWERIFARPGNARGPFWLWRNTQRRWATWPSAPSRLGSADRGTRCACSEGRCCEG